MTRLTREIAETGAQNAHLDEQLGLDRGQQSMLRQALERESPRLEALGETANERDDALAAADAELAQWQARADGSNRAMGEATKAAEVERTRIDYLEQQVRQSIKRRDVLESELSMLAARGSADELSAMREQLAIDEEVVATLSADLDTAKQALLAAERQVRDTQSELNQERQQQSSARGRLGALEALQNAALGDDKRELAAWLGKQGLQQRARLGAILDVDAGWETAVEVVLGLALEAVVVDDALACEVDLKSMPKGVLTLLDSSADLGAAPQQSLAAKVRGPAAVTAWLGSVYTAADSADALRRVPSLAARESLITPEGYWFGPGWRRVDRGSQGHEGVIQRGREIEQLNNAVESSDARLGELESALSKARSSLAELERQRELAQTGLYAAHRKLADLAGRVRSHEGRVEQERQRRDAIKKETAQLVEQIEMADDQARGSRGELNSAMLRLEASSTERVQLDAERARLVDQRERLRNAAREAREAERQLALSVESKRTAATSLEAAIARIAAQIAQITQRKTSLEAQLIEAQQPLPNLEAELRLHLDQRVIVDQRLGAARKSLEDLDLRLRKQDHERQRIDHQLAQSREKKGQAQLSEQAIRIKAEALEQALATEGFDPQAVLVELAADADIAVWEARLAELDQRIRKLEPVNLAAINELKEQVQRKEYLDAQHADLNEALAMLDDAIRKIDRETRTRFKETFDRVNIGVQELFPRLFGGGHAFLELTGEDLLSTGVNIIARPPGKKPASIGLLSGGEKALTAVALVFSIFRLNPAPFCLLDEVDAPLDEANVGRFSQMVAEMSKAVQFLVVTHNKITMEASNQLAGVTMREPGVSRLVSVDLAEATRLTQAA